MMNIDLETSKYLKLSRELSLFYNALPEYCRQDLDIVPDKGFSALYDSLSHLNISLDEFQSVYSDMIRSLDIPFEAQEIVALAAHNLHKSCWELEKFDFREQFVSDYENHYCFEFSGLESGANKILQAEDCNFAVGALKLYLKSWLTLFEFETPSLTHLIDVIDVNYKHMKEPTIDLLNYNFIYKGNIFRRRITYSVSQNCDYDYLGKISLVEGDFHIIKSSGFGDRS